MGRWWVALRLFDDQETDALIDDLGVELLVGKELGHGVVHEHAAALILDHVVTDVGLLGDADMQHATDDLVGRGLPWGDPDTGTRGHLRLLQDPLDRRLRAGAERKHSGLLSGTSSIRGYSARSPTR